MSDSGTLVWQAIYSPFGKAERVTGSVQNNLRFPGQFFDAETGLHYNWHRYYDPETGRYVSADPIGLDGGMNIYAFVENNPVNTIDPAGLKTCGSGYNEPFVPDNPFGFQFSNCCAGHDNCYETCGREKKDCDDEFKKCMVDACHQVTHKLSRGSCVHKAQLYHDAVKNHGQDAYDKAQKKHVTAIHDN